MDTIFQNKQDQNKKWAKALNCHIRKWLLHRCFEQRLAPIFSYFLHFENFPHKNSKWHFFIYKKISIHTVTLLKINFPYFKLTFFIEFVIMNYRSSVYKWALAVEHKCRVCTLLAVSKALNGNYLPFSILYVLQENKKRGFRGKTTTTKKAYAISVGCEGFWKGCFAIFLFKNPVREFQQPHKHQVLSIRFHERMILYYGVLTMLIIQRIWA